MKLDQANLVSEALALVDAQGLGALSMRALAGRLGVQPSALYWHVGDKAELISLMSASFYRRAIEGAETGHGWRSALLAFGRTFRATLLGHRDSAQLCAIAKPISRDVQESADLLAGPLVSAGLDRQTALTYQASIISFTLGWTIYEQSDAMHDHIAKMVSFDDSFEIGLNAMVSGFPGA